MTTQDTRQHVNLAKERGSADAYYGRPKNPHYWIGGVYVGQKVTDLTVMERSAYLEGYNTNEERKDWGCERGEGA